MEYFLTRKKKQNSKFHRALPFRYILAENNHYHRIDLNFNIPTLTKPSSRDTLDTCSNSSYGYVIIRVLKWARQHTKCDASQHLAISSVLSTYRHYTWGCKYTYCRSYLRSVPTSRGYVLVECEFLNSELFVVRNLLSIVM